MNRNHLDLVHELQVELGWDPDFASSAHDEYKKWLNLRAKAGDYTNCKLPPSRVVAMVWNQHRNWTLDYERACAQFGGYIHHFPPAMRMNNAREQAYAATIHTYKALYKQDPPQSFWGPAICSYKPLSSENDVSDLDGTGDALAEAPRRALPSLRRTPARRDSQVHRSNVPSPKLKEKPASEPAGRRSSYSTRLASDDGGPLPDKPSSSPVDLPKFARRKSKESKASPAGRVDEVVVAGEGTPRSTKMKGKKKMSGSLYVLRPLAPGEKRKRGRPSFSDYVLVSEASKGSLDQKKKETKAAAPTKPERGTAVTIRRRRSVSSPKATTAAPLIAKKEKTHAKSLRRVGRVAASAGAAIVAAVNSKAGAASTSAAGKAPGSSQPGPEAKEGGVPLKRPRGRPRKDGSWPVARLTSGEVSAKQDVTPVTKPASDTNSAKAAAGPPVEEKVKDSEEGEAGPETGKEPTDALQQAPPEKRLEPQSMEGVEGVNADDSTKPSSIIEGGDVQMEDLAAKTGSAKASEPAIGTMPREGTFDQPLDENEMVSKVGTDASNSANAPPKEIPGNDPVFPQSDSLKNSMDNNVEMDVSLGAMGRQDVLPVPPSASMGISAGIQAHQNPPPPPGPNFPMAPLKAVPIAPAPVVPGVTQMPAVPTMPCMPSVPPTSGVPQIPTGNPIVDGAILPMGAPGMAPKLGLEGEMDEGEVHQDDDPKKPFRRPRGRPRRDAQQWPASRKPVSDEAVERVKDLSEPPPALNFPMGPSGSV